MNFASTPIEKYDICLTPVWVKREDLITMGYHHYNKLSDPPPFSKIRGLVVVLKRLKAMGYTHIGYTETSISMAGWGVAWACQLIGLKAVIFDPQYKESCETLQYHRCQWAKFDAEVIPIKAGMAKVNWYVCRQKLSTAYGKKAILLPLGLPFNETVEATAEELRNTFLPEKFKSIVVCVGSGTIAAGVWKGLNQISLEAKIYGVMCRTGDVKLKMIKIEEKSGQHHSGLLKARAEFELQDMGWEYTTKSKAVAPFPCHPYYDLKAWEWLCKNIKNIPGPVLFWNIGH